MRIRPLALALTVVTGFSGLVYEVTWQRMLATLLGSDSEATVAVLGLFLAGLAVGYALFGRFTRRRLARAGERPPRLLFAYGILEAGIGVWALAFPLLFRGVQVLSFAVPHTGAGMGFAFDVALSAVLVLPPTVLMGATIPILTQALSTNVDDATRVHAWVYGFNSAGAVAGALAAGFWLVSAWGLEATLAAMGCVNLTVGVVFLVVGRRLDTASPPPVASDAAARPAVTGFATLASAALLVGFAMMSLQVVFNRIGALSFGASQFTFSIIVAVFVLCIAIGSLLVSAQRRVPSWLLAADIWALVAALVLLYPQLQDASYWVHVIRALVRDEPASFALYQALAVAGVLVAIGIPVTLSGAMLPLMFDRLRRRVGDLGSMAGRLYSLNTLGSLLGALIGGYVLLFWLNLDDVYRLAVLAIAVAAVLVSWEGLQERRRLVGLALAVPACVALLLPDWDPARLSAGLHRHRGPRPETFLGPEAVFASLAKQSAVRFYDDDPVASIAVTDGLAKGAELSRAIRTNGKSDGELPYDYPTTTLLGLLPALMSDGLERAFVIGFGTGVTVGVLARLNSMQEVVVAELSPAVIEAAPLFEKRNGAPLAFPGTRVVRSDAFRTLMRSDTRYDVIVSEPSNPWVTGVEMLYSRDFLLAMRTRLAPGGVFAQFFHSYEMDDATIELVFRTFVSVFESAPVWTTQGVDLILLGFADPEMGLDLERIERRFARADFTEGFARAGITSLLQLLGHEILPRGTLAALSLQGELHTLLHPRLSDAAARAYFVGRTGRLPSAAPRRVAEVAIRNSLLRRYLAQRVPRLSEEQRLSIASGICWTPGCAAYLAHWRHEVPRSPTRDQFEGMLNRIAPSVDLRGVEELEALYDESAYGAVRPRGARRATELFARHYHPAVPFPTEVLEGVWDRCEGPGGRRCPRVRDEAVAEFGVGNP